MPTKLPRNHPSVIAALTARRALRKQDREKRRALEDKRWQDMLDRQRESMVARNRKLAGFTS